MKKTLYQPLLALKMDESQEIKNIGSFQKLEKARK